MGNSIDLDKLNRIEDFINLAKEANITSASSQLLDIPVVQKVHPGQTEDMDQELNMYLLVADFTFTVNSTTKTIRKSYVFGSKDSMSDMDINKSIANERLKVDYKRMKDVGIKIKQIYF